MSVLFVNNLEISVANAKLIGKREEVGGRRAWSGVWTDQRRRLLRSWEVETTPMLLDDARRLRKWLQGRGHCWPFDTDLYSSKGLGPASYSTTPTITTGTTKFSEPTTAFSFLGSAGGTYAWVVPLDAEDMSWTVSRWMFVNTNSPWRHYADIYNAKTGVQTFYKDNVLTAVGSISNYTVATVGTNVQFSQLARNLGNSANDSVWIEDMAIVPYAMSTDMVAAIFTSSATSPFGACPSVRVRGNLIEEAGPVVARVKLLRRPYTQGVVSTFQDNLRRLVFEIHEE